MYIETVPNRNSPPAVLLRESWREGKTTRKRTLANLSDWPKEKIEAFRRLLHGDTLVPVDEAFAIKRSWPHGHVAAVLGTIRKLGLHRVIASKRSRERDLVVALVAERILHPGSKLASTRTWGSSTLAKDLGVAGADVDEVYSALDWLLRRQTRIEAKLASRLLSEGGVALYDLSSSSYYGRKCPLARLGNNRDGKKGVACIAYGLLTDQDGCPVSIEVYPGNTGDPVTVVDQVDKLKGRFKLSRVVLVGDRGMLTETQIENLRKYPGVGWISALRSCQIKALVDGGALQMSLFDEKNLAEISSADYPDERLVACYNPLLADERRRTREDLLQATEDSLIRIAAEVRRRTKTPLLKDEIGVKVGKVINRYKVGKHFRLTIEDNHLSWQRREAAIARESALDGIYVIRTSEPEERFSAEDTVRGYKRLTLVEKAFLCLKSIDLRARPIWLRLEDHVRAHFFLCMLAYFVEWHMRRALAPLLFHDEELEQARDDRDPVAPAKPSESAKKKKLTRQTDDGLPLNSFSDLLKELATLCRNDCQMKSDDDGPTFAMLTEPTPLQQRAFDLLGV
jgi:hypothetical protein